jgi:serine protease
MKNRILITILAAASAAWLSGFAWAMERVDPDGDFSNVPQRLIVSYADDQVRDMAAEARNLSARGGRNLRFSRSLAVKRHHLFELEQRLPSQSLESVMHALSRAPGVARVEEDLLVQAQFEPDDTLYPNQWHYYEATGGINLPTAWDKQTGSGVVVAVLDTGYTIHSDLSGNILPGYDFISDAFIANDGNGRDSNALDPGDWMDRWECGRFNPRSFVPSSWHGTHVAGTVAALTDNGNGVAGVAFDAMVVPVRVLGKCGGYISDIADGIIWASGGSVSGVPANPYPAQVINMSLGGSTPSCDSTMQQAINIARANGTTVIAAAGNSNTNASGFLPANCAGAVAIAAIDRQGNRAYYSNYGEVDVAAPGGETNQVGSDGVASTLNSGTTTPGSENYVYYQGTSMAAPHAAGVAALLYAAKPGITPDEVQTALEDTARPIPGSCSGGCGAGVIDASAAIDYVGGSTANQSPSAGFSYSTDLLQASFTDTSTDDGGAGSLSRSWDFGDGNSSSAQNPVHTYAGEGTYTVTLTVMDAEGETDTAMQNVTVDDGITPNEPPSAGFSYSTDLLQASFTDTSTDDGGAGSLSRSWDFGDGNGSNAQNPVHTYAAKGTYTVTLTVTDEQGATDSATQNIAVEDGGSASITLSASGYKARGRQRADLSWSGAGSSDVDIYRDGQRIATTANAGAYTDNIDQRGGGSYVYEVCEAGSSTCSNTATVVF